MSKPTAKELLTDLDVTDWKVEALADRVEKVLAMHVREVEGFECYTCPARWPCPTVRALNGADL